jgi:hypothetical protein
MRDLFEVYLNDACDFLWSQFEKDLEFSQRVVAYVQKALEALGDFFKFKK